MSRQKVSSRKVEEINDFLDQELHSLKDGSVSHSLDRRSNRSRGGFSNHSYERLPKPSDQITKKLDNLEDRLLQTQQLVAERQVPTYNTAPMYGMQPESYKPFGAHNTITSTGGLSSALTGSAFGMTGIETYPGIVNKEPQKIDLILQRLNKLEQGVSKISKQAKRKHSNESKLQSYLREENQEQWSEPVYGNTAESQYRHNRSLSKASSSGHSLGMPNSGSRRRQAVPAAAMPPSRVTAIGLTSLGTPIPNASGAPPNLASLLQSQLQTQLAKTQSEKDKIAELRALNKTLKTKVKTLSAKLSGLAQLEQDYALLMQNFEKSEAIRREQDKVIKVLKTQLKGLRK